MKTSLHCMGPFRPFLREFKDGRRNQSGVYFLIRADRIVYIGSSGNIQRRIEDHRADKEFESAVYIPVPEESRRHIESVLIRIFEPELNQFNAGTHLNISNVFEILKAQASMSPNPRPRYNRKARA